MYDSILYPTDGSAGADAALDHALHLAEMGGGTLHLLHVVDSKYLQYEDDDDDRPGMLGPKDEESASAMVGHGSNGASSGMIGRDPDELRAEVREGAQAVVDEVERRCGDVETRCEIRVGDPHRIILDYAAKHGINTIVMGTHGRSGVDRYLLGSVTEKVVRMSDVPVVTVRRSDESDSTTEAAT